MKELDGRCLMVVNFEALKFNGSKLGKDRVLKKKLDKKLGNGLV